MHYLNVVRTNWQKAVIAYVIFYIGSNFKQITAIYLNILVYLFLRDVQFITKYERLAQVLEGQYAKRIFCPTEFGDLQIAPCDSSKSIVIYWWCIYAHLVHYFDLRIQCAKNSEDTNTWVRPSKLYQVLCIVTQFGTVISMRKSIRACLQELHFDLIAKRPVIKFQWLYYSVYPDVVCGSYKRGSLQRRVFLWIFGLHISSIR